MRVASTAALLLFPLLQAQAQDVAGRPTVIERPVSMTALYSGKPALIIDYVAAMRRFEAAAGREEHPENAFQKLDQAGVQEPWTWTAADGDTVRRLKEGVFKVSRGDYLGNWFTDLECTILEWPTFLCADGQTWKMSAPDAGTVIFGEVEYRR